MESLIKLNAVVCVPHFPRNSHCCEEPQPFPFICCPLPALLPVFLCGNWKGVEEGLLALEDVSLFISLGLLRLLRVHLHSRW